MSYAERGQPSVFTNHKQTQKLHTSLLELTALQYYHLTVFLFYSSEAPAKIKTLLCQLCNNHTENAAICEVCYSHT